MSILQLKCVYPVKNTTVLDQLTEDIRNNGSDWFYNNHNIVLLDDRVLAYYDKKLLEYDDKQVECPVYTVHEQSVITTYIGKKVDTVGTKQLNVFEE